MKRNRWPLVAWCLLSYGLVWCCSDVSAQEPAEPKTEPPAAAAADDQPAAEKPAAEKPAAEKPAAEKPAAEKPAAGEPQDDSFAARWTQWTTLIDDLAALRTRYKAAAPADQVPLREQYQLLLERGREMLPQLRTLGQAAYAAEPNANPELTEFLVGALKDDVRNDRYDQALQLGQLLVDNRCPLDEVYNWLGVAQFATHDFEQAERNLAEAANRGVLEGAATQYLSEAKNYQQLWQKEQALRAKEAEADDLPRVRLTTSQGDITLELFENEAPGAVGNFVYLVESGFYNGLSFHRVLPGFMAQGGCPDGDGRGGPGYEIYCECAQENARQHFRGSLSMAHAGQDTGGSQFFLTFLPTSNLNNRHTVFGRVIEGLDVLEKIQRRDPSAGGALPEPDKIVKAEVLRKRDHEYVPNKVK